MTFGLAGLLCDFAATINFERVYAGSARSTCPCTPRGTASYVPLTLALYSPIALNPSLTRTRTQAQTL